MRLQLLHELVTMTLGVYQSTSLTTILPNPPTPPPPQKKCLVLVLFLADTLQTLCSTTALLVLRVPSGV